MKMTSPLLATLAFALLSKSASAATIDFSGISGASGSTFSASKPYTESGFTVASGPLNQYKISQTVGDPGPSLYTSLAAAATLSVTEGGSDFYFNGVDFADSSRTVPSIYTISGYLNNVLIFTTTNFVSVEPANSKLTFNDYAAGYNSKLVDDVTISLTSIPTVYVDNIGVTATPEPSSLVFLGTGLAGLAGVARRRLAR